MSVSKSFVVLIALGLFFTLAAWFFGAHGIIFLLWNILMLGLLVLDMFLTPGVKKLQVSRGENDSLYFKAENKIEFSVKNLSRYNLKVEAKDESQRHFAVVEDAYVTWISRGRSAGFAYYVMPSKRGSFKLENVYLRFHGVLGLCIKHGTYPCPKEYNVYPNVKDLTKYRLLVQRNSRLPQGDKTIHHYGMGVEFESLRPYVDGDDYRKINWAATAREMKPIVNQYQIERDQPVYILLDTGRPMSYSIGGYKKLDYAINAAIILADIVNKQGDKAGLLVFDRDVQANIPPGQGAGHRNRLMEALYHVDDNRLTANYEAAFKTLCNKQKRRSLVFIFTDFEILEEAEDLISHMALLKKRHLPIVVFMENESLNKLAQAEADPLLQKIAQEFVTERKNIFRSLNAMGIPNIESRAEEFALAAVNKYISIRG
ncbi:MAG: DUF58 domain-containing protein [Defluviitaleaceae bacterium]|nr:DUF58 domain-containing protein [Defluviitaleaceae bacterium]